MIQHVDRVPGVGKTNRKLITPEGGGTPYYATVAFADDPTAAGTPVNKLMLDEMLAGSGTTTGTGDTLVLAQPGFILADGATVRIKTHLIVNKGATLNVQSTGAKPMLDILGKRFKIASGSWVTLTYNGTTGNFILQGSGGGATKQNKTYSMYLNKDNVRSVF